MIFSLLPYSSFRDWYGFCAFDFIPAMCKAVIPIFELGCLKLTPVFANTSKTSACPHLAAKEKNK